MKLLVVCQHFWPENFRINDLCEGMSEAGIEIDVLCGEPNYPKGEWYKGYGAFRRRRERHGKINIYRCFEIPRKNNTNLRIFANYMSFPFASLFHIPERMRKKYDRILIYQLSPVYMAWAGILIGKLTKTPVITYIMDLWPDNLYSVIPFKNSLIRAGLLSTSTWCYKNSDKLICLTETAARIVKKRTGKASSDICIIPQCCEKLYETPVYDPKLHQRFPERFNLVYTGNISPAQDYPLMLRAAKLLHSKGYQINWIIVGDGMSRTDFQNDVKKAGLEPYFFFEGMQPMESIPAYTELADGLIACLCKSELLECTIPAKVMSYLASGKPLILAMNGEAQSLVNSNHCGFAGNSGDLKALVQNIAKLYRMKDAQRQTLGENSRKLHFNSFERNDNLRRMIRFVFKQ